MRLIDADSLYEKMETMHQAANGYVLQNAFNVATKYVLEAPTIDPMKHGRWISIGDGFHWHFECSECHWKDGYPFDDRHNYCPNCGAKMDGGAP